MKKDILNEFGRKHGLCLVSQQAGFGKLVTGFIPKDKHMYIKLDESLANTKPSTAYSHCDILAIEGTGVNARHDLAKWINEIEKLDVDVRRFENDNQGMQKLMTGNVDYVLSIIK